MKVLVILVSAIMIFISSILIIKDAFESDSKVEFIEVLYVEFIAFPVSDVGFIYKIGLLGLALSLFVL